MRTSAKIQSTIVLEFYMQPHYLSDVRSSIDKICVTAESDPGRHWTLSQPQVDTGHSDMASREIATNRHGAKRCYDMAKVSTKPLVCNWTHRHEMTIGPAVMK